MEELAQELDNLVERSEGLVIDPYQELARLRTCVARFLSGESLGQLFSSHADRVFSGGVDLYVRQ